MRFPTFLIGYLIILLSLHALATGVYLYYMFWWFDILMHFAGGVWLGSLGWYILFSSPFSKKISFPSWFGIIIVLMFACFVGVLWEIFEFSIDSFGIVYFDEKNPIILLKDTLLDLSMDMVGAFVSSMIFFGLHLRKTSKVEVV